MVDEPLTVGLEKGGRSLERIQLGTQEEKWVGITPSPPNQPTPRGNQGPSQHERYFVHLQKGESEIQTRWDYVTKRGNVQLGWQIGCAELMAWQRRLERKTRKWSWE